MLNSWQIRWTRADVGDLVRQMAEAQGGVLALAVAMNLKTEDIEKAIAGREVHTRLARRLNIYFDPREARYIEREPETMLIEDLRAEVADLKLRLAAAEAEVAKNYDIEKLKVALATEQRDNKTLRADNAALRRHLISAGVDPAAEIWAVTDERRADQTMRDFIALFPSIADFARKYHLARTRVSEFVAGKIAMPNSFAPALRDANRAAGGDERIAPLSLADKVALIRDEVAFIGSQKEFAECYGVKAQSVCNLLAGRVDRPGRKYDPAIAAALARRQEASDAA